MADDEEDQDQDDLPEPPQRIFTLTEAESTRRELEPFLVEAIGVRKRLNVLEQELSAVSTRIMMMGGVLVPYAKLAEKRMEHQSLAEVMKSNLEKILATGCVIKDLDVGLLDFPAIINNEEVYLCWKLGEDRIRYYHRQDEGYAGRKPLDPRDAGARRPGAVSSPFQPLRPQITRTRYSFLSRLQSGAGHTMSENRLKDSASPYLRSAARQPIDWYRMGRGRFYPRAQVKTSRCCWISARSGATGATSSIAKAMRIVEIAKIINENFIPVKVDRDERPDVDSRYQSAISAISGQGGWPLTGFPHAGWPPLLRRHVFPARRPARPPQFPPRAACGRGCFQKQTR